MTNQEIPKLEKNYKRYKKELESLMKKYNNRLSPQDILKESKKENSPLHDWFDWDNHEASEKWRLHQARLLINSIKVKIMFEKGETQYRQYLNVTIDNHGVKEKYYVPTSVALKNPDMKQQILQRAIKEAEYWSRQYQEYQELDDIFKGIKRTKKKLKNILVNA